MLVFRVTSQSILFLLSAIAIISDIIIKNNNPLLHLTKKSFFLKTFGVIFSSSSSWLGFMYTLAFIIMRATFQGAGIFRQPSEKLKSPAMFILDEYI